MKCPVCEGNAYKIYDYKDFFNNNVGMMKCIGCGHGFHDRDYSGQEIASIYRQEYADKYLDKEDDLYLKRQKQYSIDVSALVEVVGLSSFDVLDYGCSSGGYLDAMPEAWNKHGFEINPVELDYLRKKKNITLYEDLKLIERQFDLVTMRGVVEHLQFHEQLIEFLSLKVRKGGYLYVSATPDFSSVCSVLYREKWNQVSCPEHIHQFTLSSLSILLARASLVLKHVFYPYLGTPYEDWSRDRAHFMRNFKQEDEPGGDGYKHAFPGNMMSVIYEKY